MKGWKRGKWRRSKEETREAERREGNIPRLWLVVKLIVSGAEGWSGGAFAGDATGAEADCQEGRARLASPPSGTACCVIFLLRALEGRRDESAQQ